MRRKFLLILLLLLVPLAWTAEGLADGITVNLYGGEQDEIGSISAWEKEGEYWLFLPGQAYSGMRVFLDEEDEAALEGRGLLKDGEETHLLDEEGEYTLTSGGIRKTLHVVKGSDIPAVYIHTDSGSMEYLHADKRNKEGARILIYENGTKILDKRLKHIKGRGNSTWRHEKKSYNIKFNKKTEMLGMGKEKKWTLLGNDVDPTLIRNACGWTLAKECGLLYTSDYRHVDLYVNGDYFGNYVICDSVEVGEDRVSITDLEKLNEQANDSTDLDEFVKGPPEENREKKKSWVDLPGEPEDISGGYLLEMEVASRYWEELSWFKALDGEYVVIKSPEHASEGEVTYISSYFNEGMEALLSETGYNEKGKHFSEYFDLKSFARMYVLQELSENVDAGVSSCFLTKERGEDKFVFSPSWDLDHAFNDGYTRFQANNGDPTIWWANCLRNQETDVPTLFTHAYLQQDFRDAVQREWDAWLENGYCDLANRTLLETSEKIRASAVMNAIRWNTFGTVEAGRIREAYDAKIQDTVSFIKSREEYLTKGFQMDYARLTYHPNGGTGYVYNHEMLSRGDSVVIADVEGLAAPEENMIFDGWSLDPAGAGERLRPGDSITLQETETVLYAIWKEKAE